MGGSCGTFLFSSHAWGCLGVHEKLRVSPGIVKERLESKSIEVAYSRQF